ncbi:hypothetical protein F511_35767 [Dorcoceras hygrometricum]|uniref:Uncharacterized protein n=1 Tax=Dorcoceras hygrometricum TaxID=472368 RepID=A0A2Z7BVC7_9LAMI|nr:hypothetical protein F511_35767 [Dorcoceras hygrometricum]
MNVYCSEPIATAQFLRIRSSTSRICFSMFSILASDILQLLRLVLHFSVWTYIHFSAASDFVSLHQLVYQLLLLD